MPKRLLKAVIQTGQRFFPWRIAVGVAGLILGACVIRPRNPFGEYRTTALLLSFGFVIIGLSLRAWAAACAGGHTRSAHIEAPQLVTAGPYAFVRNPIYLGSLLLGLGMVGLLEDPWLLIPLVLVFGVFFGLIVPAEEQFLTRRFGEEYERYQRAVSKVIPALSPWSGSIERPLVWSAARGDAVIGIFLIVIYAVFRGLILLH